MTGTLRRARHTGGLADAQDERLTRRDGDRRGDRWLAARPGHASGDLGSLPVVIGLVDHLGRSSSCSTRSSCPAPTWSTSRCSARRSAPSPSASCSCCSSAQIDLSIGSISGLAAAILGVGLIQPGLAALARVVAAHRSPARSSGWIYGLLFTRFGVPTFVITLAGSARVPRTAAVVLGTERVDQHPVRLLDRAVRAVSGSCRRGPAYASRSSPRSACSAPPGSDARRRAAAGLSGLPSTATIVAKSVPLLRGARGHGLATSTTTRGVGSHVPDFRRTRRRDLNFFLTRTRWGRAVYAVGGNVEAARRAGINVNRIFISCLVLGATFAAIGGVFAAGRFASAEPGQWRRRHQPASRSPLR